MLPHQNREIENINDILHREDGLERLQAALTARSMVKNALFPELRAVGVEIVPAVAAETRDRAEEAGVGSRVEVRAVDARTLQDESAFTACYWPAFRG